MPKNDIPMAEPECSKEKYQIPPPNIDRKSVSIRKFFRSDASRIESAGAIGAVLEECSFSAGYESGKPMTSDSASFSPPLSFRSSPLALCFADSYCSRQKCAVENDNKLIRQYIHQKSNFNNIPGQYVKNVAKKLNLRPRKTLGFSNPKTEFFKQTANFALAS